jgi:hypothetical protein
MADVLQMSDPPLDVHGVNDVVTEMTHDVHVAATTRKQETFCASPRASGVSELGARARCAPQ